MSNELVAVVSFVGLGILALIAGRLGKTALFVLSTGYILLSNITVQLPVEVFGVEISWAVIIYSIVYLITDLLTEYHGREAAYKLAATNLAMQLVLWGYIYISTQVDPTIAGQETYSRMVATFGATAQISLAAILASAGPFLDIAVFGWIRKAWDRRFGSPHQVESFARRASAIVARNKLSTIAGQCVNTAIFFSVALWNLGLPGTSVWEVIWTACAIKIAIAVADIPLLVAFDATVASRKRSSQ